MKRIVVMLILIFISISIFTACDGDNRHRELKVDNDDIALITLYADDGMGESNFFLRNYGHAFLAIENISDNAIAIGGVLINPNESTTIGTWNTLEHFGIWRNLESNYIEEHNKYSKRVSLTIGINQQDIDKLCEFFDKNDRWTPIFNCSKFALTAWNIVAQESEMIDNKWLVSPSYLVKEIQKFNEFINAKPVVTSNIIKYYKEV